MAIMVKKLYKNAPFLYKMNLIAGSSGMTNLVQWVHIIEDSSVISFLHGNELVFTAGILNKDQDWLITFARKLHEVKASAFVVNIGPYTSEIPEKVISFCNEVGLPLFTIPWETKMVDMTSDFCHRIMHNENVESNLATTIKNIIFKVGDIDTQILQMERYGYQRDNNFCFISITSYNKDQNNIEENNNFLRMIAEKVAKSISELFISFSYKDCLILVLVNYSDEKIEAFILEFIKLVKKEKNDLNIHMGISSNKMGIYNQNNNFEKALSAMQIAKKRNELYSYYDKLGIYKVLYAVNDRDILRSYYNDIIGKLEAYDRENKTQLTMLLRTYLENNGSLQLVSEKLFIHRNTVTNQLKKIEAIIGCDPVDLENKVALYIAFYIKDIL